MSKEKNKSILTCFKDMFFYQPKEQYHFSIPETSSETSEQNPSIDTSSENSNTLSPKNIINNIGANLEANNTTYKTLNNRDIVKRK